MKYMVYPSSPKYMKTPKIHGKSSGPPYVQCTEFDDFQGNIWYSQCARIHENSPKSIENHEFPHMFHARNSRFFLEIHGIVSLPKYMKIHQNTWQTRTSPLCPSHAQNSMIFKKIHGIVIAPEYMKIHQNQ